MADPIPNIRTDTASRMIMAPAQKIYDACLDADAIARWRPPAGMECKIYEFTPREGGTYRMSFNYTDETHTGRGKTSGNSDVFKGRFLQLRPGKCIIEMVTFESNDPAFAGEMKITTNLRELPGGTDVSIIAENVPVGISAEDHYRGMTSTLQNLAAFIE